MSLLRSLRDRLRGTGGGSGAGDATSPTPPYQPAAPASPRPAPPPRTDPACHPGDLDAVKRASTPRGRLLIVNHWATWCPPCVDELPLLAELAKRLDGRADLVGISWDRFENPGPPEEAAREVATFAGDHGIPYDTILFTGTPDELFDGVGLGWRFIPQTFVLAADGTCVRHIQGELTAADVEALVQLTTQ